MVVLAAAEALVAAVIVAVVDAVAVVVDMVLVVVCIDWRRWTGRAVKEWLLWRAL